MGAPLIASQNWVWRAASCKQTRQQGKGLSDESRLFKSRRGPINRGDNPETCQATCKQEISELVALVETSSRDQEVHVHMLKARERGRKHTAAK